MKTIMITTTAIALAALTIAPASAQTWNQRPQPQPGTIDCQQQVNNQRLIGGLVGAAAGALAGRSVAGRGVRSEGGLVGAAAGAVVGSELGRRNAACNDPRFDPNRQQGNYGYQPRPVYNGGYNQGGYNQGGYNQGGYHNAGYGGGYQPAHNAQPTCGWGETRVRGPNGRVSTQQIWMCQANDGNWYPAQ